MDRHATPSNFEYAEEPIRLGKIAKAFRRSSRTILFSLLTITFLIAFVTAAALLFAPSQLTVRLPFRLEFQGAERGTYPNGTRFSSSEIVATPVLMQVFAANGLERFLTFKEFSESIFVVESNGALESLSREYEAKLRDPKLGSIDRDRLESEYQLKRESLSRNQYALTWASDSEPLPQTVIVKALNDVLGAWADRAAREKGVLRYQLPMLSANIIDKKMMQHQDTVVALDVLRTRIETILRNIAQLEEVPGAVVLRGGPNNVSLAEIRLSLADTVRFQVEPLSSKLRSRNTGPNPAEALAFLESQLAYNRRQAAAARAREASLKDTFRLYQQPESGTRPATSDGQNESMVPQVSEGFIDRIVELSKQQEDLEYRQQLVEEINQASLAVLPFEGEVAYYQSMLEQMRGGTGATAVNSDQVRQELAQITSQIETAITNVMAIYGLVSENMNPSSVLYSTTGPAIAQIDRAISLRDVLLWDLLLLLISVPLVLLAVLIAARVRDEELAENEWASETPETTAK